MQIGFSQIRMDGEFVFRMGGTFVSYTSADCQPHTPLYATAWAVKAGENSFIWASCDIARFAKEDALDIRREVAAATGLTPEQVLISATHAHTGPTARASVSPYFPTGDLSYFEKIAAKTVEACLAAWANTQEAAMSYATCDEDKCVHNRRYLMENGESKMHPGGPGYPGRLMKEGPEDPQLQAVWFVAEGKPIGIIVNYSSHPSVMYGLKYVSADYPGVMRRALHAVYGDIPVMFLQGCAGNLTPCDHEHDATWGKGVDGAERVGTVLAADVIRMIALTRETEEVTEVRVRTDSVRVNYREITEEDQRKSDEIFALLDSDRKAFDALDVSVKALANKIRNLRDKRAVAPYEDIPISAVRLNDLTLVTNPAELFVEYQLDLKQKLGGRTICAELTNGGICYVASKQGYLLKGYEVNAGFYDYNAGQTIEDAMLRAAREVRD